jgi:hypothetical protein
MSWEFDAIDKDTSTEDAILQVLIDIRDVLADISCSIGGIYDEEFEKNHTIRE